MSSQLIEFHKENAEIYHGEALCKQKCRELLERYSLPNGLLAVDSTELGYNPSSGFLWLKQKKKKEHNFQLINKTVSYNTEVTGFIEKGRLRNVTGVKSKEFIWFSITDILIKDTSSGQIEFRIPSGQGRSFPISAFEVKDEEADDQNNKETKELRV